MMEHKSRNIVSYFAVLPSMVRATSGWSAFTHPQVCCPRVQTPLTDTRLNLNVMNCILREFVAERIE